MWQLQTLVGSGKLQYFSLWWQMSFIQPDPTKYRLVLLTQTFAQETDLLWTQKEQAWSAKETRVQNSSANPHNNYMKASFIKPNMANPDSISCWHLDCCPLILVIRSEKEGGGSVRGVISSASLCSSRSCESHIGKSSQLFMRISQENRLQSHTEASPYTFSLRLLCWIWKG